MPEKIFVEEDVISLPLTQQILMRCPGIRTETVISVRDLISSFQKKARSGFDGKKALLLCKNRGRFLEPCPGTKKHLCCCYTILNTGTGCPLDCSYCVLQAYLNNPFITLFVNMQDMIDELEANTALRNGKIVRIGTGEYMDSLALEHLTGFTSFVLPFLKTRSKTVLELKTKTTHIESLLGLNHGGSLIVSWSLNAEDVAGKDEHGSALIKDRIEAARRLTDDGYRVGFHFDPLIFYPGWEDGYRKVVDMLVEKIPPSSIALISIGSLRFMPRMKQIATNRFPDTKIYSQEFIPGIDGKMRYLQEIRLEMYEKMVTWLRQYSDRLFIYFCMESRLVWKKTLGFVPSSNTDLKQIMDRQVHG